MYLGQVVEIGTTEEIFNNPRHPYTKALLEEAPRLDKRGQDFQPITGEIPSPLNPPSGCTFHPRCQFAKDICKADIPALRLGNADRLTSCHLEHMPQTEDQLVSA
nr:oligopeptide/dipeptide ABC transporter ATP-binding protein [Pseudovibrio flavus]